MTETARLKLPLLAAAQAQKHVTHNEALVALDTLTQLSVIDKDLATPPGSPAEGDCYIVASGGTGDWDDWDTRIARFIDGAWRSYIPIEGARAYVEDEALLYVFDGAAWGTLEVAGYLPLAGGTLSGNLGIGGATPDATNRLAVASPAILFNRETDDIQVKLNKAASGDDAAFIFQDGFSTRALIGLLGDDDFTFKVSPDGSAFHTSFSIDRGTGDATFLGAPKAPTQSAGNNSTKIATTAYADRMLPLAGGTLTGLLTVDGRIAFPATQNASADPNTLDDYEEGTWTPTLTTTGTQPAGVTYSLQIGRYTKIGNLVSIWVRLTLTNKGTGGTGSAQIAGLPFTSASPGGGLYAQGGCFANVTLSSGYSWALMQPGLGATVINFLEMGSGVAQQNVTWANLANNSAIFGNAIYYV